MTAASGAAQIVAEDPDKLIAVQVRPHREPIHRLGQRFVHSFVESAHLVEVGCSALLVQTQHGGAQRAELRQHRSDPEAVLDAVIGMKIPRSCHRVSGTVALRPTGLFLDGLRCPEIVDDRRQDVLGVVAQLHVAHIRAGWYERFCEGRKLDDDLFLVIANERTQRHVVVLPARCPFVRNCLAPERGP